MLYKGDCLSILDNLSKVDIILTDPPYFVLPKGKHIYNIHDNFQWDNFKDMDSFIEFTKNWFNKCYNLLNENGIMYIFWSQKYLKEGFNIFNPDRMVIWQHNNLILGGNGDFSYDYDPIFVIKKGNPKLIKGKHNCIMNYTKPQSNFKTDKLVHPTQKPYKLVEHLIEITNGNIVLDPFMGSGTTGVACKNLNKDFIGIEIDENYYKIAKERIGE